MRKSGIDAKGFKERKIDARWEMLGFSVEAYCTSSSDGEQHIYRIILHYFSRLKF